MEISKLTHFEKEEILNYRLLGRTNVTFKRFSERFLNKIFESSYNMQAIDFLINTKTTCNIDHIGLDYPTWQQKTKVNKYQVTIKNSKGSLTFMFYDSIHNTELNKKLTYDFYSVLACLSLNYSSNFDDFVNEFGYTFKTEKEYLEIKLTYLEVERQDSALRQMFTADQLELLSEIN